MSVAEAALGVPLPEAYASFLREGGPREGGTLLTLAEALAYEKPRLDRPFPFGADDVARFVSARGRGETTPLEPQDSVGSALVVADAGCNELTYLVLAGPLRGSMWSSSEAGWLPHARPDGTLLDVRGWLDEVADEPTPSAKVAKAAKRTESKEGLEKAPKKSAKKAPRAARSPAVAPLVIDRAAYQLNLRGRGLTSLPVEVAEMTSVAMVYLGGNALAEVPPPLTAIAGKLLSLELGPNPLLAFAGPTAARFTRLTQLDLRETKLTHLPDELSAVPLRELCLHGNPGLDVAQALSVAARIPTLRWLTLSRCGLQSVPPGVLALTQLERLYLGENEIETLPPELATLKLELLGLIDNRIDTIPDVLEPRIRSVYFAGNPGARAEKKRFDAIRKGFVML